MVPFAVIAYQMNHPVVRTLIVAFFVIFVVLEISYRSVELFVVQLNWASGDIAFRVI
jgi:hypothetical protein